MAVSKAGSTARRVRGLPQARRLYADAQGLRRGGRVHLYHIRKTGGTSVTDAFLALGGEDPRVVEERLASAMPHTARSDRLVFAGHDRLAMATGWFHYSWSHAPAWTVRLPRDCRTVTVLREPLSRVLSLYNYLADPASDGAHAFRAPEWERALARNGFDSFLDAAPRSELLRQLAMFSKDYVVAEAVEAVAACTLVIRTEDLAVGLERLGSLTGEQLVPRHERRSVAGTGLRVEDLSRVQRDRLEDLLAPEREFRDRVLLDHGVS